MTDSDLITRLKSAPLPERSEEYWQDFPARIRVQLRREDIAAPLRPAWRPRLAWSVGLALAVALVTVCFEFRVPQTMARTIAKQHKQFHAELARLDNGLRRLMLNTDGMGYLLVEPN